MLKFLLRKFLIGSQFFKINMQGAVNSEKDEIFHKKNFVRFSLDGSSAAVK